MSKKKTIKKEKKPKEKAQPITMESLVERFLLYFSCRGESDHPNKVLFY